MLPDPSASSSTETAGLIARGSGVGLACALAVAERLGVGVTPEHALSRTPMTSSQTATAERRVAPAGSVIWFALELGEPVAEGERGRLRPACPPHLAKPAADVV